MAGLIGSETTPTIAAVFIPEHWSKEVQLATRKAQVLAGTVDQSYNGEMSSGRVLHIAHAPNLSATTKADNTIVVPDAQTPTNQDITVSRYVYSAFNLQSITEVQDELGFMSTYTGQIGYALQGSVEACLAGMPDDLSTNVVGTYGLELTMDDWETAWQKLQVGLAPKENRYAWLSSAAVSAIRKLGTSINRDYTASNANALDNATIGKFLGFKGIESQYLEAPATGQHECAAFASEQFILIRQKAPVVEKQRLTGDLSTLVVGWEIFVEAEREIVAEGVTWTTPPAGTTTSESLTDQWGVLLRTV